ncbi:hypothetical protein N7524_008509 [Penicillium chrysogenum]|nr:hypothetical protein N7524_008509 [Penicillium chrysogenum]
MQEQFTSGRNLNARPKWCHIYHIWARNTPLPRSFAPHMGKDQGVKSVKMRKTLEQSQRKISMIASLTCRSLRLWGANYSELRGTLSLQDLIRQFRERQVKSEPKSSFHATFSAPFYVKNRETVTVT